jgi:phosphoribosylformimino-5-aminoimidazole carboxamide ribotide isomerase
MTKFRPCIDLHSGVVKQIVGSSLVDDGGLVKENFVSKLSAGHYAARYRDDGLLGGHVIMLGAGNEGAAREALEAFPNGLQVGGGINARNAAQWIEWGASHVIVTSALFDEAARFNWAQLADLVSTVGRDRLVLDLSCRHFGAGWRIAIHRWQTVTDLEVTHLLLDDLAQSCSEFLVHAVDVEGKCEGIDTNLARYLGGWGRSPVTYAGGARSLADMELVSSLSGGKLDVTVGSALDIFGGSGVTYLDCLDFNRRGA